MKDVLRKFSVGSVCRRFEQETVSRNLLQCLDINYAKPQEKKLYKFITQVIGPILAWTLDMVDMVDMVVNF